MRSEQRRAKTKKRRGKKRKKEEEEAKRKEEEEAKRKEEEDAKRKEDQNTAEGGSNSRHVSKAKTKKGKAKQGNLGHGTPPVERQRGTKRRVSTEGTQKPLHSRSVTSIITALPARVV